MIDVSELDVNIDYTNHRGERSWRRIRPIMIWFGSSDWHAGDQWILGAYDHEKKESRDFAMKNIHAWKVDSA